MSVGAQKAFHIQRVCALVALLAMLPLSACMTVAIDQTGAPPSTQVSMPLFKAADAKLRDQAGAFLRLFQTQGWLLDADASGRPLSALAPEERYLARLDGFGLRLRMERLHQISRDVSDAAAHAGDLANAGEAVLRLLPGKSLAAKGRDVLEDVLIAAKKARNVYAVALARNATVDDAQYDATLRDYDLALARLETVTDQLASRARAADA